MHDAVCGWCLRKFKAHIVFYTSDGQQLYCSMKCKLASEAFQRIYSDECIESGDVKTLLTRMLK